MDAVRFRTVGLSFGVSLGVHVVFFALLITSFSRAARAPLAVQRVRLVWVDPAPVAAPPRGIADGAAAPAPVAPAVPPSVPLKPAAVKPAAPAPKSKLVQSPKKKETTAPPVAAPAAPVAEAPPAEPVAAPPVGVTNGLDGTTGTTVGGTATGVDGGRAGGTGTALRLGDVDVAPTLVTRVVPEYPRRARLAGIEGEVVLEVIVDRHGRVGSEVRVVTSVPELERAAVDAVRRWRFRPARDRRGEVVAVVMEVPVRFVLHEAAADAAR